MGRSGLGQPLCPCPPLINDFLYIICHAHTHLWLPPWHPAAQPLYSNMHILWIRAANLSPSLRTPLWLFNKSIRATHPVCTEVIQYSEDINNYITKTWKTVGAAPTGSNIWCLAHLKAISTSALQAEARSPMGCLLWIYSVSLNCNFAAS